MSSTALGALYLLHDTERTLNRNVKEEKREGKKQQGLGYSVEELRNNSVREVSKVMNQG